MSNGVYNQLIQQGFTPDQIQSLMQLGVLNEEAEPISREYEMAQQLRQRQGPSGRFAGQTYIKAHPLEHLGAGIDRLRGEYMAQEAIRKQRENAAEKARLRAEFLKQMGIGRGGTPPIAPPTAGQQAAPGAASAVAYPYGAAPGTPLSGWQPR